MKNKFVIDQLELIRKSQDKISHALIEIRKQQRIIEDINFEIDKKEK